MISKDTRQIRIENDIRNAKETAFQKSLQLDKFKDSHRSIPRSMARHLRSKGYRIKEIAAIMSVSTVTVHTYLK